MFLKYKLTLSYNISISCGFKLTQYFYITVVECYNFFSKYKCRVNGAQGDGTQSGTCGSDMVCNADGSCAEVLGNLILSY